MLRPVVFVPAYSVLPDARINPREAPGAVLADIEWTVLGGAFALCASTVTAVFVSGAADRSAWRSSGSTRARCSSCPARCPTPSGPAASWTGNYNRWPTQTPANG